MAPNMQTAIRKIWYVGAKGDQPQGETAFKELTGIAWRTGDVYDIPAAIASQMLAHPDIFSDKSPEERARIAAEARARAAREQAAAQAGSSGAGIAAVLGSLPPGTSITLPDGRVITVSTGPAPAGSLDGAHTSALAQRLAAATGAQNEDGNPTAPLSAAVGDITGAAGAPAAGFGDADEKVTETVTSTTVDPEISLAPGATVAPAATAAQAATPAPTPKPRTPAAPAAAKNAGGR